MHEVSDYVTKSAFTTLESAEFVLFRLLARQYSAEEASLEFLWSDIKANGSQQHGRHPIIDLGLCHME